ncbi:ribonuclease P [Candidatus Bathyarchaeota archaeon]|nr:ribonuclease P [Candidatus Bathyarchaeota archaeon]MBS7631740.1 ribonuclease P [Candidatus Bathyarchaeota archaeon]
MKERPASEIALERINILFELAEKNYRRREELARRYLQLAKRIAMRNRIRIPQNLNRRMCKECYSYLVPGVTSRVRVRSKREPHVSITCMNCGTVKRLPIKRRKQE